MDNERNTEQKRIIKEELCAADHPTASELFSVIHEKYPKISRATVFRVLSRFAASGEVRRLEFLGSDTRYDGDVTPHAHCHCVRCGRVFDVFDSRYSPVLKEKSVGDFSVLSTEIEFSGICKSCKQ